MSFIYFIQYSIHPLAFIPILSPASLSPPVLNLLLSPSSSVTIPLICSSFMPLKATISSDSNPQLPSVYFFSSHTNLSLYFCVVALYPTQPPNIWHCFRKSRNCKNYNGSKHDSFIHPPFASAAITKPPCGATPFLLLYPHFPLAPAVLPSHL